MSYCDPADIPATGINADALVDISTPEQQAACDAASTVADSFMRGRYGDPGPNVAVLSAWDGSVRMYTSWLAVFILMQARGYQPTAGADDRIQVQYDNAIAWFNGVQRQSIHPSVTPAAGPVIGGTAQLPIVATSVQRGWQTPPGRVPKAW